MRHFRNGWRFLLEPASAELITPRHKRRKVGSYLCLPGTVSLTNYGWLISIQWYFSLRPSSQQSRKRGRGHLRMHGKHEILSTASYCGDPAIHSLEDRRLGVVEGLYHSRERLWWLSNISTLSLKSRPLSTRTMGFGLTTPQGIWLGKPEL